MRKKTENRGDQWSRKYKKCQCPLDYWESIIVDHDEYYGYRSTVYFHCENCSEDYAIIDFYTYKELYLKRKPPKWIIQAQSKK